MSYEEYKAKTHEIFMKECLPEETEEAKRQLLDENEDMIKSQYSVSKYHAEKGSEQAFSDKVIRWTVCENIANM